MPLDVNSFYLIRASNGVSVLARRGLNAPNVTGGGARYSVVNRPRRKSVVQWEGDDPLRMDVSMMLDGWALNTSVEEDIAKISQMQRSPGDLTPPVTVLVDGALPINGARWVIESPIEFGDAVIWQGDKSGKGHRLRQDFTIHLLQFTSEKTLSVNKTSTGSKPYTVKTGDTLASIAANNSTTVSALKAANGIRDPKIVERTPGMKLTIPPNLGRS